MAKEKFERTKPHVNIGTIGHVDHGKTTFAIDLFHFLLFGNVSKVKTQDKIFNKHIPSATNVIVEGCICIDGIDYIIKRKLSRPSLDKRTLKSKTVQKVEYYRKVGDDVEALDEYTDNMQEENTSKTNKAIKDAIGRESDFDLIMSVTDRTLDDPDEKFANVSDMDYKKVESFFRSYAKEGGPS